MEELIGSWMFGEWFGCDEVWYEGVWLCELVVWEFVGWEDCCVVVCVDFGFWVGWVVDCEELKWFLWGVDSVVFDVVWDVNYVVCVDCLGFVFDGLFVFVVEEV